MTLKLTVYLMIQTVYCTGHESVVRLLIENGADINARNGNKDSALSLAVLNGDIIKYIYTFFVKIFWLLVC